MTIIAVEINFEITRLLFNFDFWYATTKKALLTGAFLYEERRGASYEYAATLMKEANGGRRRDFPKPKARTQSLFRAP